MTRSGRTGAPRTTSAASTSTAPPSCPVSSEASVGPSSPTGPSASGEPEPLRLHHLKSVVGIPIISMISGTKQDFVQEHFSFQKPGMPPHLL